MQPLHTHEPELGGIAAQCHVAAGRHTPEADHISQAKVQLRGLGSKVTSGSPGGPA
ncbi:MAG TPA: hypothetical protein VGI28_12765 [Stellaceae bacterium]